MLIGNQVGVGLTRSAIDPMLPSYFPVKEASKYHMHGSEPPVAHPWLRPGWTVLPTRMSYCYNPLFYDMKAHAYDGVSSLIE